VAIDLIPSTSNPTAESKISGINPVSIIHIFSNKSNFYILWFKKINIDIYIHTICIALGKDGLTEILLPKDNSSVVSIQYQIIFDHVEIII